MVKKEATKDERILALEKQILKNTKKHLDDLHELLPFQSFYNHIKAHFEKEHPDWKVKCKICNKTYEEIVKDETLLRKEGNVSKRR